MENLNFTEKEYILQKRCKIEFQKKCSFYRKSTNFTERRANKKNEVFWTPNTHLNIYYSKI